MPSIPAGFLESTFLFSLAGSTHQMSWTMGWDDADFTLHTPAQQAQALWNAYTGTLDPIQAANLVVGWTFEGVKVTKQLESGPIQGAFMSPIVGTAATAPLTPNVAILWHKNTLEGGRRNRGRFFVPPYAPGEGSVDGLGVITGSVVTATQALYDQFLLDAFSTGYEPVLFHQTAPFTPTPIVSITMQPLVATQRRRLRR